MIFINKHTKRSSFIRTTNLSSCKVLCLGFDLVPSLIADDSNWHMCNVYRYTPLFFYEFSFISTF